MKIKRLFIISFVLLVVQVADAQKILEGLVLDGETLEPIVGATVSDGSKGKPLSVTNADGRFQIPNNHYASLRITYVGYKPLVTAPAKDGRYMLQTEMRNVGEVVVTAQESRGLATASKIEKTCHGASAAFQFFRSIGTATWRPGPNALADNA